MKKPFVMVVDDNRITTKLLRRYLEANGYEAKEAYDGIDCLEKVDERHPDTIVLDVMMPRLDGYETVKRLKSQDATKHIPVVIVTALNDVANQLKSIDAGADDFLSKPIEEKLLTAKVRLLSTLNIEKRKNIFLSEVINKTSNGIKLEKPLEELMEEAGL
ncbi:MAG: two-component system, sensor histidine kinase and response regulator [Bacteroidota bacterium]|nr:two-component system, sensor histidine kinase and response regulator [Bacteroidota bacterium]